MESIYGRAAAIVGKSEELSFWLLAFGFWLLAFGFWLLAFGFWLLAKK
jgi:hypothetical protein